MGDCLGCTPLDQQMPTILFFVFIIAMAFIGVVFSYFFDDKES